MSKIEDLRSFVEQMPDDPLPRYALGMEFRSQGRTEDAIATFRDLLTRHPAYLPTYQMLAQALVATGRNDEARKVLGGGIALATRSGDRHAAQKMQEALDDLADPG